MTPDDTSVGAQEFPRRVIDRGHSQARSMFIGSAIDDAGLDPYEFRIYAHLKRRAQDGEVWERQEQMAVICGMSRKTVNEVLKRLQEKRWIHQETRTHKGQRTSNLIILLEPPCNPELHGQVTQSYTAMSPTVTAKGTPHQGTPHQEKTHVISPDGEACAFPSSPAGGAEKQPHAPVGEQPKPSSQGSSEDNAACSEKVPGAAAALAAAWNEHCGPLPRVVSMTKARVTASERLLKELGEQAPALFADAVREVALDPFWRERRYGFDNLLRGKVTQKAEAYRARAERAPDSPLNRRKYD